MQQPVDGAVLSNCGHISLGALHYSTGDIPHNRPVLDGAALSNCGHNWLHFTTDIPHNLWIGLYSCALSNCGHISLSALYYSTGDIPHNACSEVGLYSNLWMVLPYLTVDTFYCVHFTIQLGDTPHYACSVACSNLWMVLSYLTVDTFHWVHFTLQLGTYHIMPVQRKAYTATCGWCCPI